MPQWLSALRNLAGRYITALGNNWKYRHQLDIPQRTPDELAFLPANQELLETPTSPLPHWVARAIMLLTLIALCWAFIGKLDVVAVARGKTITSGRTRTIQPLEPSVIKAIHVKDGQHVTAGEPLIQLDTTTAEAELSKYQEAQIATRLSLARQEALLKILDSLAPANASIDFRTQHLPAQPPVISQNFGADKQQVARENALLAAKYADFVNSVEKQKLLIQQTIAAVKTLEGKVRKLEILLKISTNRRKDYLQLYQKGHISKHEWLQQQQETVQFENDLLIQRNELAEQRQAQTVNQQELANIISQFRNELTTQIKELQDSDKQYLQEIKKYTKRKDILVLTSPVNGTVQQLAVHTVGGVVTEAQTLLSVVPDNETLQVEAMIENKDIGFIQDGQRVVIKVDSFPFTRYGYLQGEVESVSLDAVEDENQQWVFPTKIRLQQDFIVVKGKKIKLTPGMSVRAEIKTEDRKVIDFFLSPLRQYLNEGLRER